MGGPGEAARSGRSAAKGRGCHHLRSDSLACPERLVLRCIRMIQGKPWERALIFRVPGEGRSAAP
jgi:hypothetical protein